MFEQTAECALPSAAAFATESFGDIVLRRLSALGK